MPSSCVFQYLPLNGASVALQRVTLYCSSVRRAFSSSSVGFVVSAMSFLREVGFRPQSNPGAGAGSRLAPARLFCHIAPSAAPITCHRRNRMNILVLGGGQQGRVLAAALAASLPAAKVTVADVREPVLPAATNLRWLEADLSSPQEIARLLHGYDLGVGALPSRFGYGAMLAAIDAKRPLVDVSFSAEDPLTLDAAASRAGVAIVPDCGLAPGLSHLLVGDAMTRQ